MKQNIVLIGPSGIGKTTIGRCLSKKCNKYFIDTDQLIEEELGISIENIFKNYGENYFRNIESSIVNEIYIQNDIVIATGGGIVLNSKNVYKLKQNGIIFLLYGSISTIIRNLNCSDFKRPLIDTTEDIYKQVKNMMSKRKSIYKKSADYIINVDNKSIEDIANEIICFYTKH